MDSVLGSQEKDGPKVERPKDFRPGDRSTYVSMGDDPVAVDEFAKALGLNGSTPIVSCQLRDRDSVLAVVAKALELVPS